MGKADGGSRLGEGNRNTVSVISALFLLVLCLSCDKSQAYLDTLDSVEEELSFDLLLESAQPVAVIQAPPEPERSRVQEGRNVLRIACTGWAQQLVEQVKRGFESNHPGYQIQIFHPRADQGLQELLKGNLDLMLSSKVLSYTQKRQGLRQQVFARRAWVPVVNKANPLLDLSKAQLGQILDGRTQQWPLYGRQFADISTVILDRVDAGQHEAWKRIFPDLELNTQEHSEKSWMQVVSQVSRLTGGIALVPVEVAQSPSIKILSVDGKRATHRALVEQSYPLGFDVYVTYTVDCRAQASRLKDYVVRTNTNLAGPGR